MNPRVENAVANDDYTLTITFRNGEMKIFDVRPHLKCNVFNELKELAVFKKVQVSFGTVIWETGQDFCPDTLYLESHSLSEVSQKR